MSKPGESWYRLEQPVPIDHQRIVLRCIGHKIAVIEDAVGIPIGVLDDRVAVRMGVIAVRDAAQDQVLVLPLETGAEGDLVEALLARRHGIGIQHRVHLGRRCAQDLCAALVYPVRQRHHMHTQHVLGKFRLNYVLHVGVVAEMGPTVPGRAVVGPQIPAVLVPPCADQE